MALVNSNVGLGLSALGALVATFGVGYFVLSKKKSASFEGIQDVDGDDIIELPDLSRKQILDIFTTINTNMQNKVRELGQQLAQIEAQMKQAGQALPEKEIYAYLSNEFETHLAKVQEQVLEKYKTDEEEFEEATEYYEAQGDDEVKGVVDQLLTLYKAMTGSSAKEPSKDLTKEKFLAMMEHYFDCMFNGMESLVEEHKAKGVSVTSPEMQQILMTNLDAKVHSELAKKNISNEEFQGGLMKYQGEQEVMLKFQQLQQLHAERSAKLGVQFM